MRIGAPKQAHYDSGPNMTPLVDVVMVILIFLMLAGSFAGSEWYLESNLPFRQKGGGGAAASVVPDDVTLDIRVDPANTKEGFVAFVGDAKAGDAASLLAILDRKRDGFTAAGKKTSDVQLIINPHKNVKLQAVVDVFQAAQNAKFYKIGFAQAR